MVESVYTMLVAPWTMSVIFAAVRLEIFTILSSKTMTLGELALKCNAHAHLLKPLLHACDSIGLLARKDDKYFNSHFSRQYLVEGEPRYVGDLLQLQYDELEKWMGLYDVLQKTGRIVKGRRTKKETHRTFIKAMNNLGMLGEAEALINAVDLSGCKYMADAGGGSGLYSLLFCQKYSDLIATILDKRETLTVTKEMISKYKESQRITLQEADITQGVFGENLDVVLLSDVIYDEAAAIAVLKNAWDSLHKKGILVIRGYYSDPEGSDPLFGSLFVMGQLVFDPDRKILTVTDLEKIVKDSGFIVTKRLRLTERSFVVLAYK